MRSHRSYYLSLSLYLSQAKETLNRDNDSARSKCADSMRVLGVILDRRVLTFDNHASAVARSCNYHARARAIRHIRHLLTLDLAQTLNAALFSLESTNATLCCTALHPAPFRSSTESRTTRRVSFYECLDGQTCCFRRCTGCLLNSASTTSWPCWRSRQQTSSPQYLSQHILLRTSARNTRSSSVPLLCVPFRRTSFARRSFSTASHLTWNSLPPAMLNCDSLSTFKSRLKTHLFLLLSANCSTYLFR